MDESSWSSPNPLPCQHPLEDGGPRHVGGSSGLSKELAVEDERIQKISVPESGVHLQTQASPTDSIRKREDRSTDSSEHRTNAPETIDNLSNIVISNIDDNSKDFIQHAILLK